VHDGRAEKKAPRRALIFVTALGTYATYYAAGRSAASQFKFKNLKKVNAQNRQSFFFRCQF
jgi:hypothetical protein